MQTFEKRNDALGTVNRGDPVESGLCTLCESGCKGKCETWMTALKGRQMLYPRDFGEITAGSGNMAPEGVGYHSVRVQGYAHGTGEMPEGLSTDPDDALYKNVDVETSFGNGIETRCKVPLMTGALGSTFIAEKYWDSFAIGAALCGLPIVIGENVVGVDRSAELEDGEVVDAPELDRRIETYQNYADGEYGGIFVQLNVEDYKNGVAEYVRDEHGDDVIVELKWGQGAKSIGGEIQVDSVEYAQFLQKRGYVVDPDPTVEENQLAFEEGGIDSFARHSRLGATDAPTKEDFKEAFMEQVDYLRDLGFGRISLKTGAYSLKDLAMSMKFASEADLDLLTIDGAGGGTGMSPWNMMEHWGIPSLHLHSKVYEYAEAMEEVGVEVPDLSLAGGLAREDHIVKAIALGSPHVNMVCMGRAMMIPGFLGSNVEGALNPERKEEVNGHWDKLPRNVTEIGETPESIFAGWEDVKKQVGGDLEGVPYGAVALWNLVDKLKAGTKQLLAGTRNFKLEELDRSDLMAANEETSEFTGLPHMTEAYDEEAKKILRE